MRTFFVVCFYVLGFFLGGLVGRRVFSSIVHRVKGKHEDNRHECCGICGHPLTRVDMFPVLGFLMRKGRCRYCGAPIPGDSMASEVIKVNGKTSGLEPGDESEHLVPPFVFKCVVCDLHIVLHCGIIDT